MKLKQSNLSASEYEFITVGANVNPYMFKQSNFVLLKIMKQTITNPKS